MVSFVAIAAVTAGVGATATATPTWEEVTRSVTREKLSSVESFLDWFATNETTQLEHFTLMRKSGGAQDASEQNPRAIVFGKDARFVFTFNGDSSQRGYDSVEILQFRERTNETPARWELREIRFPENGPARFSEANPGRCVQCHGASPQPLWAQYDFWPGAYGELDDAIRDFDAKYMRRGSDTDAMVEAGRKELAAYRKFLASKDRHPRYSKLVFPEGSPVTPYNTNVRTGYKFRPNLAFTKALVDLQKMVVADRLAARPEFTRLGPALTEDLLGCVSEPTGLEKAVDGKTREERFAPSRWSPLNRDERRENLRIQALRLLGAGPREFAMTPSGDHYSYFEGQFYLQDWVAGELYDRLRGPSDVAFAAIVEERDRNYRGERNKPRGPSAQERACRVLAKRRAAALRLPSLEPHIEAPPVVLACLRCHDGRTAPLWNAAGDEEKWLGKVVHRVWDRPKGLAMPPDRALDSGELAELMNFLESRRW